MTTNTGSARQDIRDTADANGWTMTKDSVLDAEYRRDGVVVWVTYSRTGAVLGGSRDAELVPAQHKRNTILAWLTKERAELDLGPAANRVREASRADRRAALPPFRAEFAQAARSIPAEDRAPEAHAQVTEPAYRTSEAAARIVELEREVERLAGVDAGLAEAQERIADLEAQPDEDGQIVEGLVAVIARLEGRVAHLQRVAERGDQDAQALQRATDLAVSHAVRADELERRLELGATDYRAARTRITELEDAPVRKHARRLVEALVAQRDGAGLEVSLSISRAAALLADALGMDTTRPEHVEPEAEPVSTPDPATTDHPAGQARPQPTLRLLAALGVPARRGLPGERVEVRETHREHGHPLPRVRVLGFLCDGVFTTDEGRGALTVGPDLLAGYLDHVRALGYPGPTARRLAAERAADDVLGDQPA